MIVKMIDMLTPQNGKVLDPHVETLTTKIGALKSFRFCDLIKKDFNFFRKAVEWFAKARKRSALGSRFLDL